MSEPSKPNGPVALPPKRIVLFRFDENPEICRNHLQLLKKYNPDVAVHGLYSGPAQRIDDFRKILDPYLSTVAGTENKGRSWHKMNQDLEIRQWFGENGSRLDFDVVHVIDQDILVLDCLENLYAAVDPCALGLSGLIRFEKLKNRHSWVKLEKFKQQWQQQLDAAAAQYGYNDRPFTCVLAGACFPKSFLEKYAGLNIPELVHGEMRVALYAQILGFEMHDTGFYKSWFKDAENRFFNLGAKDIRYDSVVYELQKPGGARIFRPYADRFYFFCDYDQAPTLKGTEHYELDTRRIFRVYEQFSGINQGRSTAELIRAQRLGSRQRLLPENLGPLPPVEAEPQAENLCPSLHKLNQAMDELNLHTMVDIGCFLLRAAQLNRRLRAYIGLHTQADQLKVLSRASTDDARLCFLALPAQPTALPVADMIAVDAGRMSEPDCWYIFNMITAAKASYFVAPLEHLRAEPYGFPEPARMARHRDQLLGWWPLDRHLRRFFAKEPQAIRKIRTPLVTQLVRDLHRLHAALADDRRTEIFIRLFQESASRHEELFKDAKMKDFFTIRGIMDIRNQLCWLTYMSKHDRFLPDYRIFETQDPQTQRIQSYLTLEALMDFGVQQNLR